ncbi:MAG TPA: hypothetical protein VJC10_00690 [Patescibacteria group bacterium]|nr:hypothetical protein [Patescibacteria group bacterium]
MGLDTPRIEDRTPINGVSGASEFVIPNQPGNREGITIGTGVDFPVIFINDALHHPDKVGPHRDEVFNVDKWKSEITYTIGSDKFGVGFSLIPGIYVGKGHMPFDAGADGEAYRPIVYPGEVQDLVNERSENGTSVIDLSGVKSPLALIVEPIGESAMSFPDDVDVIVTLYKPPSKRGQVELEPIHRYRALVRNGVRGQNYYHIQGEYTEFEELPLDPSQSGSGKKGPLLVSTDKDSVLTLNARFARGNVKRTFS